jgi:hypothetical protein
LSKKGWARCCRVPDFFILFRGSFADPPVRPPAACGAHGRSDGETRLLLRVPYVPPTRARSLFSLSLLHSMSLPRTRGVRPAEATSDMIRVDSARPRVAVRDTTRAPSLLDGPAWASHTPSPIATFGISLQSTGVPIPACAFALPRCPSTERRDHVAWAQPPCSQRVLFASHSAHERS